MGLGAILGTIGSGLATAGGYVGGALGAMGPYVAPVMNTLGGAAGIYSALSGGGGGAGGGGGGGGMPASMSQGGAFLNDLFGTKYRIDDYGMQVMGNDNRNPGIFGSDQKDAIADLLNPLGFNAAEALAEPIALSSAGRLEGANDIFNQALGGASEVLDTGFLTDAQPIIDQRKRDFFENILPQLRETNAASRFSSDAVAAETRAAGGLETDLGALQAQLKESANSRRLQALGLAPALGAASAALPLNIAADLANFGASRRGQAERMRPGSRALDIFSQLEGLSQTQPFYQPGFNPSGSATANTVGALASAIPGIVSSAQGLFSSPSGNTDASAAWV